MDTLTIHETTFLGPGEAALRDIYLERLRHLLRLRHEYDRDLNVRGLRLLDHSIFAAYCDCRDVGAEAGAQELLREAHVPVERPKLQLSFLDLASVPEQRAPERSTQQARPKR
jgi:hypothetical protein